MSVNNKSTSAQIYRLMLYQRALHPELFNIQGRKMIKQDNYELEAWIMPSGHAMRFQTSSHCLTEVIIEQEYQLPERGLVHSLPCLGEKEYDETVDDSVRFIAAVQTELLTDNLYATTLEEMKEFAEETNSLTYEWHDRDGNTNLSMLDIQQFRGEIHTQGYHMIASPPFVLRTQSIFEVL